VAAQDQLRSVAVSVDQAAIVAEAAAAAVVALAWQPAPEEAAAIRPAAQGAEWEWEAQPWEARP